MDIKEIYSDGYNTSHEAGLQAVYDAGYEQGVKDATTPMHVSMDQVSMLKDPVSSSGTASTEATSDEGKSANEVPESLEQVDVTSIPESKEPTTEAPAEHPSEPLSPTA